MVAITSGIIRIGTLGIIGTDIIIAAAIGTRIAAGFVGQAPVTGLIGVRRGIIGGRAFTSA